MIADTHPQQAERLAALRRYAVLDTPREAQFDEVVALAARICEAPISVVNLIDADRQWFKAEVGLGVRETPLATSLCSHVILEDDFVEIPDTLEDPRMADNPLCLADEGPLRFYAGARLLSADGLPIGTLCVLDNKPRRLTDLQRETIRVLGRQVMRQLDLRLALQRQEVLRREIDHRVKNSLGTVSALVGLQAGKARHEETRTALAAVRRRVEAVAAVHRELHQAGEEETVDLSRFMDTIGRLMAESALEGVRVDIVFDPVRTGSREASALAMIVNEFVANSLKHAFPDGRGGTVSVRGRVNEAGDLIVVGRDDGVGDQGDAAPNDHDTGLGHRIIEASVAQIGAHCDAGLTPEGARMTLTVPASNLLPADGADGGA